MAAGSNCVRLRGRHSGRRVWKQCRRQRRRTEQTSAHIHQRIHHLLGDLRHRPLHVQPSSPATLSTYQPLGKLSALSASVSLQDA